LVSPLEVGQGMWNSPLAEDVGINDIFHVSITKCRRPVGTGGKLKVQPREFPSSDGRGQSHTETSTNANK
jgi:hypothetical protein